LQDGADDSDYGPGDDSDYGSDEDTVRGRRLTQSCFLLEAHMIYSC